MHNNKHILLLNKYFYREFEVLFKVTDVEKTI